MPATREGLRIPSNPETQKICPPEWRAIFHEMVRPDRRGEETPLWENPWSNNPVRETSRCRFHRKPVEVNFHGRFPLVRRGRKKSRSHLRVEFAIRTGQIEIRFGDEDAFYHHKRDYIMMPDDARFESLDDFYITLLHEMAHWTGHAVRLKRKFASDRHGFSNSRLYLREELVAELAAAFLCHEFGLGSRILARSYTQHFVRKILDGRAETRARYGLAPGGISTDQEDLEACLAHAVAAAEYLLALKPDEILG